VAAVVALHLPGRVALLDDGRLAPIVNLFDVCGDATDDTDLAAAFLAQIDGYAFCDLIHDYDKATLQ